MLGAVVEPGAEDGVARAGKLLQGILRKRLAGLLQNQLLVSRDDFRQVLGSKLGIELGLGLLLLAVEDRVEIRLGNFQHHGAVHLDEAAVAIVSEAGVVGLGF